MVTSSAIILNVQRIYTRRQLMHWKSLEVYNYCEIESLDSGTTSKCIMMASVNPSQSFGVIAIENFKCSASCN